MNWSDENLAWKLLPHAQIRILAIARGDYMPIAVKDVVAHHAPRCGVHRRPRFDPRHAAVAIKIKCRLARGPRAVSCAGIDFLTGNPSAGRVERLQRPEAAVGDQC